MLVKSGAVEAIIARPNPKALAVLLYGPDQGLVGERTDRLALAVISDLRDPFRAVEFSPATPKRGAGRLRRRASHRARSGGRRCPRRRLQGLSRRSRRRCVASRRGRRSRAAI